MFVGGLWPEGSTPVAEDVPPAGPLGPEDEVAVGMAGTGAGLPAARTTLGDPVAPSAGFWVANLTCGTVTSVDKSEVVNDAGIG